MTDKYLEAIMAKARPTVTDLKPIYDEKIFLLEGEIERLRELLKHADDVSIWEGTSARLGFQEEVEAALGISLNQQSTAEK